MTQSQADRRVLLAALDRLVKAAAEMVRSTVLVPMAQEDDDDVAEFWCAHPDALSALRAAIAEAREVTK